MPLISITEGDTQKRTLPPSSSASAQRKPVGQPRLALATGQAPEEIDGIRVCVWLVQGLVSLPSMTEIFYMQITSDHLLWHIAKKSVYGAYFAKDLFLSLATRYASKRVNFRQLYLSDHIQSEVLKMASHLGCLNPLQNEEWVNLIEKLPNELLLHIIKMLLGDYDLDGDLRLKTNGFEILVETIRRISQRLYSTYFTYYFIMFFNISNSM